MKVVASKIKFYGIFLWRKTNNPPEYIENLLSVSVDIAIRLKPGLATTAHAVMKLNAEDGGNRTFIMVQLPEDLYEAASRPGLDSRLKQ